MADVKERPETKPEDRYFVVDAAYLKHEAREGARTFLAPFTGVYRAFKLKSGKSRAKTRHLR